MLSVPTCITRGHSINTLRPRQNGRHFPDDIFKCIFLNENVWILLQISLKFVPKGPINNIPALVQIMAWRRPGDKPLSEPRMESLLTHICVTRPQWVKQNCFICITILWHIIPCCVNNEPMIFAIIQNYVISMAWQCSCRCQSQILVL